MSNLLCPAGWVNNLSISIQLPVRRACGAVAEGRVRVPVKGESVVREDLDSLEVMEKITFDRFEEWKTYATAAYNMNKDPLRGELIEMLVEGVFYGAKTVIDAFVFHSLLLEILYPDRYPQSFLILLSPM